jgi:glycosyltransferase involved in cell wall biosynthesis
VPERRQTERLRVVTLTDHLGVTGGAERIAVLVTMGLDSERFDRTICSTRTVNEAVREECVAAGVRVLALERRSTYAVWDWLPLVRLLRRERVDVLHAHKFRSNVWAAVLGTLARVPVVVAHEHGWERPSWIVRLLNRRVIARGCNEILAISRAERTRMIEIDGIPPDRVNLMPNGIPKLTPTIGRNLRKELGIPPRSLVIGSVATLRPEKALEVLIEAAEIVVSQRTDVRVLIVGEGPENKNLRSLVRSLGLEKMVFLIGERTDISDIVNVIDIAVCCSDREGSPLSVMEYMAAGKPVVATNVGGLPEMIEEGVNGLLVERRDAKALADALLRLLNDEALREHLGAAGKELQLREFSLDAMIKRTEALYEELVKESRTGQKTFWRKRNRRSDPR